MKELDKIHAQAFATPIDISLDLQGWCPDSFQVVFDEALKRVTPKKNRSNNEQDGLLIFEIGTWKGLSTTIMADRLQSKGIRGRIVAIDTWLGGVDHLTYASSYVGERNRGMPRIYEQFLANVQHKHLEEYIYPFPMASMQASLYFRSVRATADIIYIDADHEFESVISDIRMFWPLLKPGGVMIFDDYQDGWPGVVKAIQQFAAETGNEVNHLGCTAFAFKPLEPPMFSGLKKGWL